MFVGDRLVVAKSIIDSLSLDKNPNGENTKKEVSVLDEGGKPALENPNSQVGTENQIRFVPW